MKSYSSTMFEVNKFSIPVQRMHVRNIGVYMQFDARVITFLKHGYDIGLLPVDWELPCL